MLRAGGYFAWAAQPVYKHEEAQEEHWKGYHHLKSQFALKLLACPGE